MAVQDAVARSGDKSYTLPRGTSMEIIQEAPGGWVLARNVQNLRQSPYVWIQGSQLKFQLPEPGLSPVAKAIRDRFMSSRVSAAPHHCGQSVKDFFGWTDRMWCPTRAIQTGYFERHGYRHVRQAAPSDVQVGDIVAWPNMARGVGHVGIALGNGLYISNIEGRKMIKRIAREPGPLFVYRKR